jgi:hypothetical protein
MLLSPKYQQIVNVIRQVVNFQGLTLFEFPEYKLEFERSASSQVSSHELITQ